MKEDNKQLNILELQNSFSGQKFFRKPDLRNFYAKQNQELTEQNFRRILYTLEKMTVIQAIDAGVYILANGEQHQPNRKKYKASLSSGIKALNESVHIKFPYIDYLLWETSILNEFMTLQPGQNQLILETEKDTSESVFDYLSLDHQGKVFLNPDMETMERYVLRITEPIIISQLISQSPRVKVHGLPYPKIEKILVDLLTDEEKFFAFQGQELIRIYENVFETYQVSEKTLFRYAERRKVSQKLRAFICKETSIELIQNQDDCR